MLHPLDLSESSGHFWYHHSSVERSRTQGPVQDKTHRLKGENGVIAITHWSLLFYVLWDSVDRLDSFLLSDGAGSGVG